MIGSQLENPHPLALISEQATLGERAAREIKEAFRLLGRVDHVQNVDLHLEQIVASLEGMAAQTKRLRKHLKDHGVETLSAGERFAIALMSELNAPGDPS